MYPPHKYARHTIVSALVAVLAAACSPHDTETPDRRDGAPPGSIVLAGRYETRVIAVEIADDLAEQTKGLMDRTILPSNHGMLFVYSNEEVRSFWMHNTHIALDMLFLDRDQKVVGIIRRARPDSDDVLSVGKPSMYVLEVEGGLSDRVGIQEGDRLEFR